MTFVEGVGEDSAGMGEEVVLAAEDWSPIKEKDI